MKRTATGLEIERSAWTRNRDCIAELETSASGNVVMRVMRENGDGRGVHQVAHVVLTPNEADLLWHDLEGVVGV